MTRPSTRTVTIALVTLLLPVTLLVGSIGAAYYKASNPDNVDITQDLAYLSQTMVISITTFVVLAVASVVGMYKLYRADGNMSSAKLPLTLLVATVVLIGAYALVGSYIGKVQDQYLIDHGRPTLQQFFDKLDKEK